MRYTRVVTVHTCTCMDLEEGGSRPLSPSPLKILIYKIYIVQLPKVAFLPHWHNKIFTWTTLPGKKFLRICSDVRFFKIV